MSSQRPGSAKLDTAIAADSLATPESLAASIPPELFKNILAYVGDQNRLGYSIHSSTSSSFLDPDSDRREEMKHVSACALTCFYWAQLTRQWIFERIVLRSSEDMSGLLSLLRAPQSTRIPPIWDILEKLDVSYTLGDPPWFHSLARLKTSCRVSRLGWVNLYITGPASPRFVTASTRGSMLHPLFLASPRILPVVFPEHCDLSIYIEHIHLPNPTMFFNLFQDCLSLLPRRVSCTNLSWDPDSSLQATPSSVGSRYSCPAANEYLTKISSSGCTDDVLVAAMLNSVPHHEFSQRRHSPHLNPPESSYLFDIIRITRDVSSPELEKTKTFHIWSDSDSNSIQKNVAVGLLAGTDFCLEWMVSIFEFRCIASRLPDAAPTSNNIRNITYIIIDLRYFDGYYDLQTLMKTAYIDWDTFLHAARQFPHLRQITIQHGRSNMNCSRKMLIEFLAHLGGAWLGLDGLLGLYYYGSGRGRSRSEWVQLQLDTMLDEIKQKREEIKEIKAEADAEKAASSELESSVVEEESSTHSE